MDHLDKNSPRKSTMTVWPFGTPIYYNRESNVSNTIHNWWYPL